VARVPASSELLRLRVDLRAARPELFDGVSVEARVDVADEPGAVDIFEMPLVATTDPRRRVAAFDLTVIGYRPGEYTVTAIIRQAGVDLTARRRRFTR
jgi:hypothetical protein